MREAASRGSVSLEAQPAAGQTKYVRSSAHGRGHPRFFHVEMRNPANGAKDGLRGTNGAKVFAIHSFAWLASKSPAMVIEILFGA